MYDPFEIMGTDPYALDAREKRERMGQCLSELTRRHNKLCPEYARILASFGRGRLVDEHQIDIDEAFPLPVRIFKEMSLKSVDENDIAKTMTSSGTTSQKVSKIYLSKKNTRDQTRALAHIIDSYIGPKRLPLLVLDTEKVRKDRRMYSARGAGVVGFMTFGRDVTFALDEDMNFRFDEVQSFLERHGEEKILLFGYTFMVWKYIVKLLEARGETLSIENGLLFHTGGWKKLIDEAVDSEEYNARVRAVLGNVAVHNYYGMAEQLGGVFVECEQGHLHCSVYSDVVVRSFKDLSVLDFGQRGFLEVLSVLPTSYPGHVLITEDEGEILGEDDCPCGRLGRYFKLYGRVAGAELRGCSDTYEQR